MIISYNWLCDYLPIKITPSRLSQILTSIGLEVESIGNYETYKGGLKGLIAGEIIGCEKHPDADKLTLTKVNIGLLEPLQIICGAANVAAGQKVIVAPVGSVIYPFDKDPVLIKKATIRGIESEGMICAEDEIGLGKSHDGILVLPEDTAPGVNIATLFDQFEDVIYEIGITPNRTDAMSHLGVAKDVCAYLSHHDKKEYQLIYPGNKPLYTGITVDPVKVIIEDQKACRRYSGISIRDITVRDSPFWLAQKLKSIGVKPINNIVDITNFILHETGQPLHAFDEDKITGKKIIVRKAAEGTLFKSLDEKERKLSANDLLICNEREAMCIAGIYGGIESGVTGSTKNIFIESAWFDPVSIRRSSMAHGLRTDAAVRFEKGTDISNTVQVLKRAAQLVIEITGGSVSSDIVDVYPFYAEQTEVLLPFAYLKKLSGKEYPVETIKNILTTLGFT
ncbi:MAG TPA: phenylalanine--tRNA ligase subunit beta, partial [Ferruginibacter sp.]|nr:phenylalanine--tRNA ligase subunit beta [Ferruginibacter sp.]